jgi:tetratricopeptide (TPR) repeat protein
MKKSFFLAILFFGKILAQTDSTYFSADILSEILESYNIKNESAVEILTRLHENPIDLNSADFSTLRTLPFLSVAQIQSLIKLRNSLPDGISNYSSLLSLPEFDMQDVEALRYFTLLKAKSTFPKISAKYKTRANRCYSDFSSNDFEGNLFKTYGRLFLNYANNYSINVLLKKDAGEKSYADFTSFYFEARNLFSKFTLLLGDYQMEFGQGLALWNPYAFGKSSADAEAVIRSARGIFGNTLTAEGQGFRGIALKYSQSQFTVRTFYSNRKLSASLDSTQNLITAIDYSGYHRTPKEISKKGRLQLNSYGLSIEKNWRYIPGYILAAKLYLQKGQLNEAINLLKQGVEANPENTQIILNLAEYLVRTGDPDANEQAKKYFRQILKLNPACQEAQVARDYLDFIQ